MKGTLVMAATRRGDNARAVIRDKKAVPNTRIRLDYTQKLFLSDPGLLRFPLPPSYSPERCQKMASFSRESDSLCCPDGQEQAIVAG